MDQPWGLWPPQAPLASPEAEGIYAHQLGAIGAHTWIRVGGECLSVWTEPTGPWGTGSRQSLIPISPSRVKFF